MITKEKAKKDLRKITIPDAKGKKANGGSFKLDEGAALSSLISAKNQGIVTDEMIENFIYSHNLTKDLIFNPDSSDDPKEPTSFSFNKSIIRKVEKVSTALKLNKSELVMAIVNNFFTNHLSIISEIVKRDSKF